MTNSLVFVLATLACVSLANAMPRSVAMAMDDASDVKPVNVTLYYESLCPDCMKFIESQLGPVWDKVKDTKLMTVNLLPYGNAREKQVGSEWKFECQHGPNECMGNLLETCIVHYYPDTTQQLNVIQCVEQDFLISMASNWEDTLRKCSESNGIDVEKVSSCVKGPEGNTLEHTMASLTGSHEYVPWIILDGTHTPDAVDDLLKQVCKAYKGTPPSACK